MTARSPESHHRGPLDGFLSLFTDVRSGEGPTALLLMANAFILLFAYYLLKPLREGLILGEFSAEAKSMAAAVMAVVLVFFVPLYSAIASRVDRIRLVTWVTLFFVLDLVVFFVLGRAGVQEGIAFFVWVGIFNLMIVAQFWAFANDVYTPEAGRRLFAIVGFGSAAGAAIGPLVAGPLVKRFGLYVPMLVAGGLLLVSIVLFRIIHAREHVARAGRGQPVADNQPIAGSGAFRLVFSQRYLLLIALLMLVYNCVNTNGEFILGKTVKALAHAQAPPGTDPESFEKLKITEFYSGFFLWVNILTAVIQLFLVGRIFKWFGVRVALFVLPLLALGGYTLIAIAPVLSLIRGVKIAENATDYSLQSTARQALFLPTSREAKYKAKAAIDSFFVRMGDVLSWGFVSLATVLALTPGRFAVINIGLVLVWLGLVVGIVREHRKLAGENESAAPAGAAVAAS